MGIWLVFLMVLYDSCSGAPAQGCGAPAQGCATPKTARGWPYELKKSRMEANATDDGLDALLKGWEPFVSENSSLELYHREQGVVKGGLQR